MKIVAFETSCIYGGVAISDSLDFIDEVIFSDKYSHSKSIIPTLAYLLKRTKWSVHDIDLICINVGPGSYTGLRIGLAYAKTLSFALNKPLKGVSSTSVISMNLLNTDLTSYSYLIPVIDAHWEQVYFAIYKIKDGVFKEEQRESVDTLQNFLKKIPSNSLIVGDAIKKYKQLFLPRKDIGIAEDRFWYPTPSNVLKKGLELYQNFGPDNILKIAPQYLRLTEPEVKKNIKLNINSIFKS